MAQIEIRLPKMGESVTEATITNWLKNIGDSVAMDEPLVEVATDKVDNELPSEAAGTLVQILFEKDQVAQVGDVIAILSTDGGGVADAAPATNAPAPAAAPVVESTSSAPANTNAPIAKGTSDRFYSPLVRTIAQKENISAQELAAIQGT
ncbi:MAG: 2-oxo acid dehydrogenase subunit E2, partial [Flavobacteriia bacterium]